jgi:hypothetical protein
MGEKGEREKGGS